MLLCLHVARFFGSLFVIALVLVISCDDIEMVLNSSLLSRLLLVRIGLLRLVALVVSFVIFIVAITPLFMNRLGRLSHIRKGAMIMCRLMVVLFITVGHVRLAFHWNDRRKRLDVLELVANVIRQTSLST